MRRMVLESRRVPHERRKSMQENQYGYGKHGAMHHVCPNCGADCEPRRGYSTIHDFIGYAYQECPRCTSRIWRAGRWLRELLS